MARVYSSLHLVTAVDLNFDLLPDQAVADLNRQTGANVDPAADPGDLMQSNARGLMAAVSSLPELTERKRAIDKHMNLATHMLKARP